jgi:multiple sugar transport system substrate-binding protein
MLKKMIGLGLACLCCVSVLTGCGDQKDTAQTKDETITVMVPDWGAPPQEMLDEFKKESGVTVKVEVTSWDDTKSKVATASAGKKAPADVFEVDWSWAGEFGSAGWLEKLTPDEAEQKDIPTYMYFKSGSDYVATPYVNDLRFAYFNTEMAKQAGITTVPATAAELEQNLLSIKNSGAVAYPFLFPLTAEEKTTTSFLTLAYTRNGTVFNDDGTLNKDSALDTLTTLKQYLDEGLIDKNNVSTKGIDVFRGIKNGTGAFLLGPTSFTTSTNDPKESKVVGQVTTIPIPSKNGVAPYTVAFPEALGISAFSEHKEAAKKFVKWYTSKETQIKLNKAINNPPTRMSALQEMTKGENGQAATTILNQLKIVASPFPNGVPKDYTKISTEIFNVINQLGQGQLTPQEAADTMTAKVNAIVNASK